MKLMSCVQRAWLSSEEGLSATDDRAADGHQFALPRKSSPLKPCARRRSGAQLAQSLFAAAERAEAPVLAKTLNRVRDAVRRAIAILHR